MTSASQDPFQKQPTHWRAVKRMGQRLHWLVWVLGFLGLLGKNGPLTRHLLDQFKQLEHGLRCLLVIASRNIPMGQDTNPTVRHRDSAPLQVATGYEGFDEPTQFSLTLADISAPNETAKPSDNDHSPLTAGPTPKRRSARVSITHQSDFMRRLDAIAGVFSQPELYIDRMSRLIAKQGYRLRGSVVMPPHRPPVQFEDAGPSGGASKPAFLDSS